MTQLSFFSAEAVPPAVSDLTGLLATAGQIVQVGTGARLSVVVEHQWRAVALADLATMIGALTLARALGPTPFSDELLAAAKAAIR